MHHRHRRTRTVATIVVALLVLAACGRADVPTETWTGVAISDGTERSVTLEVERRADRITGAYRVDGIPGEFEGTVHGDALSAELRPSDDCAYVLEGTITSDRIEADYEPSDCPDGTVGRWTLERTS